MFLDELSLLRGMRRLIAREESSRLTRFGWVRLQRCQVVDRGLGRYTCPLDAALALRPRQHASPWIVGQVVALATRIPYRQAAHLLVGLVEAAVATGLPRNRGLACCSRVAKHEFRSM